MPKYTTDEDLDLLNELGVETAPDPVSQRSAREERIIAGFEEIERFVELQGRLPQHGEDRDIFERLYAVRLDRLRDSEDCRAILKPLDSHGLLDPKADTSSILEAEDLTDEALLASLGIDADSEGERQTLKYQDNAAVNQGDLFILDGQKVLVANMGEPFVGEHGRPDCRLRVIYDNATENDLLLRSLQRALNKDKASRRITKPKTDFGPLFSQVEAEDDLPTGYIYVLRSKSDDPFIAENRTVIHKIGVTGGDVKKRIANAKKDPTYLLADVEIIATFKLANIKGQKLETLLHKFFDHTRLDVQLPDRFGIPVNPREWFLVPLEVIEEVIEKIREGTIEQYRYDPKTASLTRSRSVVIDKS